ncbi:MAG: hypothetical protein P4L11_08395 [Geothrix sp.]|nr:hypothetical protein [Geothrix sp.]
MTPPRFLSAFAPLALAALCACGGGGGSAPAPAPPATATGLAYTDPATGTYRLVKDPASSGSHLVLDLLGPSSGTAMGASIALSADTTKVTWVDVPAGGTTATLMKNGTQFDLGSGIPILRAKAAGNGLQATVAQKHPTPAAALNGTLLQVALDLKPGLGLPAGTALALSADGTRCQVLDGAGTIAPITVAVGALTAQ